MDICHDHKIKFVESPWNSAFIDTSRFIPNSTAKHEVLNGDCLNVIWSCMLVLVTNDWNTDPHVLLAGLRAWQLSSAIQIKKTVLKLLIEVENTCQEETDVSILKWLIYNAQHKYM